MHIQLFTCILLIFYINERESNKEKREKERNKNRYAELMSKWIKNAPQLGVIYDIQKEKVDQYLPPPRSMGIIQKGLPR